MILDKNIIIQQKEFSQLLGEIEQIFDGFSPDGIPDYAHKFPAVSKLVRILNSEVVKEQSTYNFDRIQDSK